MTLKCKIQDILQKGVIVVETNKNEINTVRVNTQTTYNTCSFVLPRSISYFVGKISFVIYTLLNTQRIPLQFLYTSLLKKEEQPKLRVTSNQFQKQCLLIQSLSRCHYARASANNRFIHFINYPTFHLPYHSKAQLVSAEYFLIQKGVRFQVVDCPELRYLDITVEVENQALINQLCQMVPSLKAADLQQDIAEGIARAKRLKIQSQKHANHFKQVRGINYQQYSQPFIRVAVNSDQQDEKPVRKQEKHKKQEQEKKVQQNKKESKKQKYKEVVRNKINMEDFPSLP